MNQNTREFEAAVADAQCSLAIITAPGASQSDREVACLMLSQAADDFFSALTDGAPGYK